jgi:hypothetical protein
MQGSVHMHAYELYYGPHSGHVFENPNGTNETTPPVT